LIYVVLLLSSLDYDFRCLLEACILFDTN
jgi:hypothetical protein